MTDRSRDRAAPTPSTGLSLEYRLQHMAVAVVTLDEQRRILAANGLAQQFLFRGDQSFLHRDIGDFHPPAARERIGWLIGSAASDPKGSATMIVATRMGNMLALATLLKSAPGPEKPHCSLLFFMLGNLDEAKADDAKTHHAKLRPPESYLSKLPLEQGGPGVISLVDVDRIIALRAQGHYAEALMAETTAFCPRSLSMMEKRLDPTAFLRVHRAYLVNISHIRAAERVDGAWWLILGDKARTRAPISRQKVAAIRNLLAV